MRPGERAALGDARPSRPPERSGEHARLARGSRARGEPGASLPRGGARAARTPRDLRDLRQRRPDGGRPRRRPRRRARARRDVDDLPVPRAGVRRAGRGAARVRLPRAHHGGGALPDLRLARGARRVPGHRHRRPPRGRDHPARALRRRRARRAPGRARAHPRPGAAARRRLGRRQPRAAAHRGPRRAPVPEALRRAAAAPRHPRRVPGRHARMLRALHLLLHPRLPQVGRRADVPCAQPRERRRGDGRPPQDARREDVRLPRRRLLHPRSRPRSRPRDRAPRRPPRPRRRRHRRRRQGAARRRRRARLLGPLRDRSAPRLPGHRGRLDPGAARPRPRRRHRPEPARARAAARARRLHLLQHARVRSRVDARVAARELRVPRRLRRRADELLPHRDLRGHAAPGEARARGPARRRRLRVGLRHPRSARRAGLPRVRARLPRPQLPLRRPDERDARPRLPAPPLAYVLPARDDAGAPAARRRDHLRRQPRLQSQDAGDPRFRGVEALGRPGRVRGLHRTHHGGGRGREPHPRGPRRRGHERDRPRRDRAAHLPAAARRLALGRALGGDARPGPARVRVEAGAAAPPDPLPVPTIVVGPDAAPLPPPPDPLPAPRIDAGLEEQGADAGAVDAGIRPLPPPDPPPPPVRKYPPPPDPLPRPHTKK